MEAKLVQGQDGKQRCWWCGEDEEYVRYHDQEWGRPVKDDQRLFEKLCLEGFQAGLSWLTILRKRPAFRAAFAEFEIDRVARFGQRQVDRLLQDAGIVRHRGKIEAAINNAEQARSVIAEFGSLAAYLWSFEPDETEFPGIIAETDASKALAKDLKKRGWKFVGSTTMYAFMQSMGMVNDHVPGCFRREPTDGQRARFRRPRPKSST